MVLAQKLIQNNIISAKNSIESRVELVNWIKENQEYIIVKTGMKRLSQRDLQPCDHRTQGTLISLHAGVANVLTTEDAAVLLTLEDGHID